MSAERNPPAPALLARPLAALTRLVLRHPTGVLAAAVCLAALSLTFTGTRLGFRTRRSDLLSPESTYNQLWMKYIDEFGDQDDAVVVVEGAGAEPVIPVLKELASSLKAEDRLFQAVLHQIDRSGIRAKGLYFQSPEELRQLDRFLTRVSPVLEGDWSVLSAGNVVGGMSRQITRGPDGARDGAQRLALSLDAALREPDGYRSPWPQLLPEAPRADDRSEYLLSRNGRLGMVVLHLVDGDDGFVRGNEAIERLRQLIAQAARRHPEVKIGLTGLPVMENDEMRASQTSMLRASWISLAGVACLFMAGFGGVRHPAMTVATLLLAMAWSFGYLTLAVGHLNILSVSFGAILIGLGIDFGIHYLARYLQLRRTTRSSAAALEETAGTIGPGIVTGAVTTAIAFFCAGMTDFTGVAELGVIAGGGVLLCAVATLVVLPALVHVSDHHGGRRLPRPLSIEGFLSPLFQPRCWKPVVVASFVLTAVLAVGLLFLRYDNNLLNLQPRGLESVQLERHLLQESDQNAWFAISIAPTRDELLRRRAAFLRLPSVERVEEIASLLPPDLDGKRPLIESIRARLGTLPRETPTIPLLESAPRDSGGAEAGAAALAALDARLGQVQSLALRRWGAEAAASWADLRQVLAGMPPAQSLPRLTRWQQRIARDLLERLQLLREVSNPEPPGLSDLPEGLVSRFVGKSEHYLLRIYGRGNIWDSAALRSFVEDVRRVDPDATGHPLQAHEASLQMKSSYQWAALYALGAIVIVLLLDFRSFRDMLLALVPLGLGIVQTFGLLGWLGMPLNPANVIVLPLILGIGIDDGVHVMHDYRSQRRRYQLSSSTAAAVLMTSLTSMIGIGSLMTASHLGLQSLGRVLTIGVTFCLLMSLVTLPAMLTWLTSRCAPQVDPESLAVHHPPLAELERRVEAAAGAK